MPWILRNEEFMAQFNSSDEDIRLARAKIPNEHSIILWLDISENNTYRCIAKLLEHLFRWDFPWFFASPVEKISEEVQNKQGKQWHKKARTDISVRVKIAFRILPSSYRNLRKRNKEAGRPKSLKLEYCWIRKLRLFDHKIDSFVLDYCIQEQTHYPSIILNNYMQIYTHWKIEEKNPSSIIWNIIFSLICKQFLSHLFAQFLFRSVACICLTPLIFVKLCASVNERTHPYTLVENLIRHSLSHKLKTIALKCDINANGKVCSAATTWQ